MAEKLEKAGRALVEAWCRTQSLPPIEFAPDELDALVTAVLTATPDRSDDALAEERAKEAIGILSRFTSRMTIACDQTRAGKDHVKVATTDWHALMGLWELARAALKGHGL